MTPSTPDRKLPKLTMSRRVFMTLVAGLAVTGGGLAAALSRFLKFSPHTGSTVPTGEWQPKPVVYWHENQVTIMFHIDQNSSMELEEISQLLRLEDLNQFLNIHGLNLKTFGPSDVPSFPQADSISHMHDGNDLYDSCGKWLLSPPTGQGTLVLCSFHVESTALANPKSSSDVTSLQESDKAASTRPVVNIINRNLDALRQDKNMPVIAAMPNWLGGATQDVIHGCPVVPPIPVENSCAAWKITLQPLSPTMQSMTGDGVTVFVLDTMPTADQILKASQQSENNNLLLKDIAARLQNGSITIKHQMLPQSLWENAPHYLSTGKDIYGQLVGFDMPDHGLFVTGIVHDLVPNAKIEWIRVLNDFGVGDLTVLVDALQGIQRRLEMGDLRNRPVVINLSLVMTPYQEVLLPLWFGSDYFSGVNTLEDMTRETEFLRVPLHTVIQSLTRLGAVIVASAGNDSNSLEMPMRMGPRYPAAFPEVISVGAVDKNGEVTRYSNYPALPPQQNGIVTYGGGLPKPVPPSSTDCMTGARNIDALVGIYSSPYYPALSVEDCQEQYAAPAGNNAWAYWSGTSFATPIISALAARVLEKLKDSDVPSHLWSTEVQKAITTPTGQQDILGTTLDLQPTFGASLLKATQVCQSMK